MTRLPWMVAPMVWNAITLMTTLEQFRHAAFQCSQWSLGHSMHRNCSVALTVPLAQHHQVARMAAANSEVASELGAALNSRMQVVMTGLTQH